MTNAETIEEPVLEQKRRQQELKALHLKAGQHAAKFAMLAQLLRDSPGAIVFDEQSTRQRSDSIAHFESKEFSGVEIKELVGQIREHEDRLSDLRAKSDSFRRELGDRCGRSARSNTASCQRP